MLDGMVQDVRHGVRILKNSPGFAATASLSLAIAIGANTTIFSIANALLMRPPRGVASPSTLVDVGRTMGGSGFDTVSYPNYQDLRDRTTTLDGLYASETDPRPMSLGGDREAERPERLRIIGRCRNGGARAIGVARKGFQDLSETPARLLGADHGCRPTLGSEKVWAAQVNVSRLQKQR